MNLDEINLTENSICPICSCAGIHLINLPAYPLTEIYQKYNKNEFNYSASYDQGLNYCESCQHGYLKTLLPRNFIYENYNTHTAESIGSILAIENFYEFIKKHIKNTPNIIIDVGANDTSLLKKFKYTEAKLIGIDPNITSDDQEIECIKGYIEDVEIGDFGKASKLFLSSHTLEHIFEPEEFLVKLNSVSSSEDELFFQFPSLDLLVRDGRFDQVHHQHIQYFTLHSFKKLLLKCGFEMIDYCFDSDHYGTLMSHFKKISAPKNLTDEVQKIHSNQIILSYHTFVASLEASNLRLELDDRIFSCFGASLMLPIIGYYMPNLYFTKNILDSNSSKFGLSYINFDRQIVDANSFDYLEKTLVVTAISTKMATRKIVKNLIDLKVKNIILPYNTL